MSVCAYLHLTYRIGDDAMFFLLHKCSLFHPLKNGSFLQISGLYEMYTIYSVFQ